MQRARRREHPLCSLTLILHPSRSCSVTPCGSVSHLRVVLIADSCDVQDYGRRASSNSESRRAGHRSRSNHALPDGPRRYNPCCSSHESAGRGCAENGKAADGPSLGTRACGDESIPAPLIGRCKCSISIISVRSFNMKRLEKFGAKVKHLALAK